MTTYSKALRSGDFVVRQPSGKYIRAGRHNLRVSGIYQAVHSYTLRLNDGTTAVVNIPEGVIISGHAVTWIRDTPFAKERPLGRASRYTTSGRGSTAGTRVAVHSSIPGNT